MCDGAGVGSPRSWTWFLAVAVATRRYPNIAGENHAPQRRPIPAIHLPFIHITATTATTTTTYLTPNRISLLPCIVFFRCCIDTHIHLHRSHSFTDKGCALPRPGAMDRDPTTPSRRAPPSYAGPPSYTTGDDEDGSPAHLQGASTMRLLTHADDAPGYVPYVYSSPLSAFIMSKRTCILTVAPCTGRNLTLKLPHFSL